MQPHPEPPLLEPNFMRASPSAGVFNSDSIEALQRVIKTEETPKGAFREPDPAPPAGQSSSPGAEVQSSPNSSSSSESRSKTPEFS